MDIYVLRLEALKLAWDCEQRPPGATYPQPDAADVIERAQRYLAFLEGKLPDVVSSAIFELSRLSPRRITQLQRYARQQPPRRAGKNRKHR